jgi:hypothetical protein
VKAELTVVLVRKTGTGALSVQHLDEVIKRGLFAAPNGRVDFLVVNTSGREAVRNLCYDAAHKIAAD